MKIDFKNNPEDDNSLLKESVEKDTELKEWLVNYVGEKCNPKDESITVEMIVATVAQEFPEFVLAVAEENFFRGYKQAFEDIESGYKTVDEQEKNVKN